MPTPTRCSRRTARRKRCALVEARLQVITDDHRLYLLQARGYAALDKRLAQHRAQAEAYVRTGNLMAAMEQLRLGLKSGDGDFYQVSSAESRLRELRKLDEEMRREAASGRQRGPDQAREAE